MTLKLELPPDLEKRLLQESERQGVSPDTYALQLVEAQLAVKERQRKAVALVQSWIDDPDAREQQETGEYLIQALDQDRPSYRKLFPEELKGETW